MTEVESSSQRLRIRFTKSGDLRWISHLDLARVWERLLRRAELELAFSQGFHPKPKISFPTALPLGIESLEEIVELELVEAKNLSEIQRKIATQMPTGMRLLSMEPILGKAKLHGSSYRIEIPQHLIDQTQQHISALKQLESISVQRQEKTICCLTSDPFFDIALEGNQLFFSLPVAQHGASLRPNDLLELLHLHDLLSDGGLLQRTGLSLKQ